MFIVAVCTIFLHSAKLESIAQKLKGFFVVVDAGDTNTEKEWLQGILQALKKREVYDQQNNMK